MAVHPAHRTVLRKINVGLPEVILAMVEKLEAWLHLNQTQVVRDAIETRYRLQKEIEGGATLVLEWRDEQTNEVQRRETVWLPRSTM
jgi:hypothetical protein